MTNSRTAKSAREKAAELRAEAQRQEARRRTLLVSAAVAAVLVVIVAAVVIVKVAQNGKAAAAAAPPNVVDNGIVVGNAGAKVTITMYEDFLCPVCKRFEDANAAQLAAWAKDGTAKLIYKPVSILDSSTTTGYSSRAQSAAGAVVAADPSKFPAFHALLYANQPAEGSPGLPDSQLLDYAVQSGVARAAVESAITTDKYQGWAVAATDAFSQAFPNGGTPTVLVNGQQVKDWTAAAFKTTVEAAAK